MKYEILLFDIDNTLLDFDCNEFESFKNTMLDKGIEYTLELYNNYKERKKAGNYYGNQNNNSKVSILRK